jgi:formate/nitrite transporter FocA (FNT family)
MYVIPMGLLVEGDETWLSSVESLPDLAGLTWSSFFLDNLLPVTIGNILGGTVMVGAIYWFAYLRPRREPSAL